DTIALRVPGGAIAQSLLIEAGVPIAAPSANISGRVSATTAAHVAKDLGDSIAMVLDGGNTTHGIESTIVRAIEGEPVRLLRAGAIERDRIEAALDCPVALAETGSITAPGQLESHYAPHARLRLDAGNVRPGEVLVAFGAPPEGMTADLNLSPSGDLVEAAANLFSLLRRLDDMGAECAAIMPIPEHGLGEAINDRLRRASAPRQAQEE
ncbi:MAG: translation factor Sua5, partial [Rhizobiales bacterium]|nr:translation factor Sua5 [Hyphomicrobiales bacterium]